MTDLERLRAVLEAATPGPWTTHVEDPGWDEPRVGWVPEVLTIYGADGDMMPEANARAIAALGTLWPELLAVAEAAEDDTTQGVNQALRALVAKVREVLPEVRLLEGEVEAEVRRG